jgi:hypothetical protein
MCVNDDHRVHAPSLLVVADLFILFLDLVFNALTALVKEVLVDSVTALGVKSVNDSIALVEVVEL